MNAKVFFLLFFIPAISFSLNAQLKVEDNNTVRLGNKNLLIYLDSRGRTGQAKDFIFEPNLQSNGLILEQGLSESSGLYLGLHSINMWSPANTGAIIRFCDEDRMSANGNVYDAAVSMINSTGEYLSLSDSTQKENILPLNNSLNKILKMQGKTYYYKEPVKKSESLSSEITIADSNIKATKFSQKKVGFLAQEIETVIPEAVETKEGGMKYINYSAIIPVLTEAMKEQQNLIDAQNKKIELLEQQIKQLSISISDKKL